MEFIQEIRQLEISIPQELPFITSCGKTKVLITALNAADKMEYGILKVAKPWQKSIARYIASHTDSSYYIKIRELENDDISPMAKTISIAKPKLIIDLNVTSGKDIKIKAFKSLGFTIINEIIDAFKEEHITKVIQERVSDEQNGIPMVEIEIPKEYRNIDEPENMERFCQALINFIKQYTNIAD